MSPIQFAEAFSIEDESRLLHRRVVEEFAPIIAESRHMKDVVTRLEAESRHNKPIAWVGESGTGKELCARHLHAMGGPLVTVDVTQVAPEVLDQVLFGYVHKPIFGRPELIPGMITKAAHGSLWILGLEHLPWTLQELFVPVIAEGRYRPLDTEDVQSVQCRLQFGINLPAWPRPSEGILSPKLSEVLQDRAVTLPALRERREDIIPLAQYFMDRYGRDWGESNRRLSVESEKFLKRYRWPGNVRELGRTVAVALTMTRQQELEPQHFPLTMSVGTPDPHQIALEDFVDQKLAQFFERIGPHEVSELHEAIQTQIERPLLKRTLLHTDGNQLKAARLLGINRNTLRSRLQKYGIR